MRSWTQAVWSRVGLGEQQFDAEHSPSQRNAWSRAQRWLATLFAINVFVIVLLLLLMAALTFVGVPTERTQNSTVLKPVVQLALPTVDDSWWPMLKAYRNKIENPDRGLYSVFFQDGVKFQYPPSALLPLDLLPYSMTWVGGRLEFDETLKQALRFLSLAALVGTVLVSVFILKVGLDQYAPGPAMPLSRTATLVALGLADGFIWYPLIIAHNWGQVQVFLNFLIAAALLLYLLRRPRLSGACIGLCCLFKPQYGLLLVWSGLRRLWGFSLALLGVVAAGTLLAVWRYGITEHLVYVDVLSFISRHGEAVWINQSLNGLLHRFLENGDAVSPPGADQSEFPPFNLFVYLCSLAFTVLIVLLALWPRKKGGAEGTSLDFATMIVAVTIASPVAWIHQYGAFLPVFALFAAFLASTRQPPRYYVPLYALSYLTMAFVVVRWQRLYENVWIGLLGSHIFYAGMLLLALLLYARYHYSQFRGEDQFAEDREPVRLAR